MAMVNALGGHPTHVAMLRTGHVPDGYPLARLGLRHARDVDELVAMDVARWWVEEQDKIFTRAAARRGAADFGSVNEALSAIRWRAFQDPASIVECL